MTARRIVIALSALAHAWTWGVGLFLVSYPHAYRGTSTTRSVSSLDGTTTTTVETGLSASLIETNGLSVLPVLLVPIVVSGLFLAVALSEAGGRAVTITVLWATAILMLGFCVLGAASIGFFYVPGALAMLAAASFWASGGAATTSVPYQN